MAKGKRKADLDTEILAAQQKVIKTKASYDKALDGLQKLLIKRDEKRKEELWNAVLNSEKTYEEILEMIIKKDNE